jgi:hypothetical protein
MQKTPRLLVSGEAHGCVPGTAHVLRVSLYFPIMEVKASPKPSQMEAKGIVLSQRGIR